MKSERKNLSSQESPVKARHRFADLFRNRIATSSQATPCGGEFRPRAEGSGVPSRRSLCIFGVPVLVALAILALTATPALAVGDANEASCPQATEDSPGFRSYLPDCRAYELVSPPSKDGYPVFPTQVSPDGEGVVASSYGSFSGASGTEAAFGNTYRFVREPEEWRPIPLDPPAPEFSEVNEAAGESFPMISPSGATVVPAHRSDQSIYQADLYIRQPAGQYEEIGPMLPPSAVPASPVGLENAPWQGERIVGASDDLSRVIFSIQTGAGVRLGPGVSTNLWPGDETIEEHNSVYEYVGTGHSGQPGDTPALVGVDNDGAQITQCGTSVPTNLLNASPAISAQGSVVLFAASQGGCSGIGDGPAVEQLYARLGTPGGPQATVNVAATSECGASDSCNVTSAPTFWAESKDGSRVFFTTEQSLVSADTNATVDLYECELPGDQGSVPTSSGKVNACPSMHLISASATGSGFQDVVASSEDGSHVYFTASGILTEEPNQSGVTAVEGANNLYAYQRDAAFPAGHLAFVAQVNSALPSAETTPDGRFLVLAETAQLTPDDTTSAQQIFKYDAQAGSLIRLSIGDQGYNQNGNGIYAARLPETFSPYVNVRQANAISDSGSQVIFLSPDALTPNALEGRIIRPAGPCEEYETIGGEEVCTFREPPVYSQNLYEYSGGRVFLISDGQSLSTFSHSGLAPALIDGSGRDIFFSTTGQLEPRDGDTLSDVYDARSDGGFPLTASESCNGEGCQGPVAGPPPETTASSSTALGGGNAKRHRGHHKKKKNRHHKRKRQSKRKAPQTIRRQK